MIIPIFIHHEGAHSYIRDCIIQAREFNKRVILFGDKSNSNFCDEWYDVSNFSSPLWEEFKKYYKHMSSNGSKFELMCFKRFFIFDEFMLRNGIEDCITLDSDVLVFVNFSKISAMKKCNAAFSVSESTKLAWGGHGYWKQAVLHDFLLYCVDIYKNHQNKLEEMWNIFRKKHLTGGISDMTLLYWWFEEKGKKIWVWTKYNKAGVMDDNFSTSANYQENEYYLDKLGIGKRILIRKKRPYFISVLYGPVRACSIHFQGNRKKYMHYFRKHLKIAFWLPYLDCIKKNFARKSSK